MNIFKFFICKHKYKFIYKTFKFKGFTNKTIKQYKSGIALNELEYHLMYSGNSICEKCYWKKRTKYIVKYSYDKVKTILSDEEIIKYLKGK